MEQHHQTVEDILDQMIDMQPIQQATSTIYSESEGSESESTDTPLDGYSQAMAQLDPQIRNRNKETHQTRKASVTPNINTPPSPSQHAPSSKGTSNNPNRAAPSTTTTPRTGKPSPTYGPTRSAPKGTSHKQRHKIR